METAGVIPGRLCVYWVCWVCWLGILTLGFGIATVECSPNNPCEDETMTATDIRTTLPVVVKSGTTHKPVWTLDDKPLKFVAPLNKEGRDVNGNFSADW